MRSDEPADAHRLALDRLEGRRGGGAGARELPPLASWPFYEVAISDVQVLAEDAPELQGYRILDLSQMLDSAYVLANRWQKFNTGRSLGFNQTGATKLSSAVATLPVLTRQLQGLAVFGHRRNAAKEICDPAFFETFLLASGADEHTAAELRAVVVGTPPAEPHSAAGHAASAAPLPEIWVAALVGVEKGSALAVWTLEHGTARVEFCIGHDCLANGPQAEEDLLRLLAGRATAAGATRLRCRVRFTEDGRLFAPQCFASLGLQRHVQEGEEEFEEDLGDEVAEAKHREVRLLEESAELVAEVPEAVSGLRTWLAVQGLQEHMEVANAWCEEMGAATLGEVIESREDLVEALGGRLSAGQQEALLKRSY